MALTLLVAVAGLRLAVAQQEGQAGALNFDEQSAALRTALHYDPILGQPLQSLVDLYRDAGRVEELVGLYRAHVAQYPDDAGAQVVLVRILKALDRADAVEMLQSAVAQHAAEPMLHYLLYQEYRKSGDDRAAAELARAVELQENRDGRADRADAWLAELIELGAEVGSTELVRERLLARRAAVAGDAARLLEVAQHFHDVGLDALAVDTLDEAAEASPDPETGVEIDVLWAIAKAALDDAAAADERLEALLGRLATDHWRRSETVRLRVQLAARSGTSEALITAARETFEAATGSRLESAALDYAELLLATGRAEQARQVLIDGLEKIPTSERLEKLAVERFAADAEPEQLATFLEQRLGVDPNRQDLRYLLARTRFITGDQAGAEEALGRVLDSIKDTEERVARQLELARDLRGAGGDAPAATLLQKVAEAWPRRLDVRRELAELWLEKGRRAEVSAWLRASDVGSAEIEDVLDLVQFMASAGFHVEVRDAVERRLEVDPERFELVVLMVETLGRLGERVAGERWLARAEELADTPARYRRWVEAGLGFYEPFDEAADFFASQHEEFASITDEWTQARVERYLALLDAGAERELDDRVTRAVREQLADADLPPSFAMQLRRALVKALEHLPGHAGEVEEHLLALEEIDAQRVDEYRLRRALLYHGAQRPDLVGGMLGQLGFAGIDEAALLRAAYVMLVDLEAVAELEGCLGRLLALEPADLVTRQRQISLYAALGREADLRRSLVELLAGIDGVVIDERTRGLLRSHRLDSCWRSIVALSDDARPEAVVEIETLLDEVDRAAEAKDDRLWAGWTRAWLAHRRGQDEQLEAELQRLEAEWQTRPGPAGEAGAIVFPDGVATSVKAARRIFDAASQVPEVPTAEPGAELDAGPQRPLRLDWAFACDADARLVQVVAVADSDRVLVMDERGVVYCLNASSGKLIWRETFGGHRPVAIASSSADSLIPIPADKTEELNGRDDFDRSLDLRQVEWMAELVVLDGYRSFLLPFADGVRCFSVADGSLLWEADLSAGPESAPWAAIHDLRHARPPVRVAQDGDRVLAFAAASGVAAAIDAESGKLIWLRTLAEAGSVGPAALPSLAGEGAFALNCGAAFGSGRMMVFGERSAILDSCDGKTLWWFGAEVPRRFPLLLGAGDGANSMDDPTDLADSGGSGEGDLPAVGEVMLTLVDHRETDAVRAEDAAGFVQFSGALLAPAAHWDASRHGAAVSHDARLVGDRVLLMDDSLAELSMTLPLESQPIEVGEPSHSWLGAWAGRAWLLAADHLRQIDLDSGESRIVPLDGGTTLASLATLHGGRLYLATADGLQILNALSGERIAELAWPADLLAYLAAQNQSKVVAPPELRVWQGAVFERSGQASICLADSARLHVSSGRVLLAIGERGVVSLSEEPVEGELSR